MIWSDIQYVENHTSYPRERIYVLDASSDFDMDVTITKELLNERAAEYAEDNDIGRPSVNLTVSFINLAQTAEFADTAPIESVRLCDEVTVYFPQLGVDVTTQVIRTRFDCILERFEEIELGDVKNSFADTIKQSVSETMIKPMEENQSFLEQAFNDAKKMLTGAYGGHIVPAFNANKQWNELFAIDTTDPNTATKGLRLNANGLGAFQNGIDGDYVVAITIDGQIVADRITTGTLRAIDIEGVNITGSTITGTTITGTTINGSNINGSTIKFGDDQKNITFEKDDSHDRLNIYGSDDIDINSLGQIRIISSYTYDLGGARSYLSLYNSFNQWNDQYQSAELRTYPSQQSTGVPASLYGNSYMNVHNSVLNVDGVNSSYYGFDIVSMIGGRNCSIHGQTNSDTNKGSYVLINGGSRQFRIGDYFNNDYTMYADGHKMIGLSATDQINFFLGGTNILSARNDGRLYARNGVTYGTVMVGRDTHSYSISWDGSHAYLWVDVTRVGQIV